jgi:hypothetical protein
MALVTVVVDDAHLDSMDEVAAKLRSGGMQVTQVLRESGVISGSISEDRQDALQRIGGVESIDQQTQFHLPPPESDLQ